MSSPYRYGKTSGISTVAIVIVAVVVIAGLGAGVFFVLPQLSSESQVSLKDELLTYNRFGISFAYPEKINLREARLGERAFAWGFGRALGDDNNFVLVVSWQQPNDELSARGANELNELNLKLPQSLRESQRGTDLQIGPQTAVDFKGRAAQKIDFSYLRSGDSVEMEGLSLSFFESDTGRLFQIQILYLKSLAPLSQQILDSFRIDSTKPPPKSSLTQGVGDLETCEGFLRLIEVKIATGRDDIVFNKVLLADSRKNHPKVVSACSAQLRTGESGIVIEVFKMVSADEAIAGVDRTVNVTEAANIVRVNEEPYYEITRGIIGENSAKIVINKELLGTLVVVQDGAYQISVFTIIREPGESPLVTPDQLVDFAKLIISRLP